MATIKYKVGSNGLNIMDIFGPVHTTSFTNLDSVVGATWTLRRRPMGYMSIDEGARTVGMISNTDVNSIGRVILGGNPNYAGSLGSTYFYTTDAFIATNKNNFPVMIGEKFTLNPQVAARTYEMATVRSTDSGGELIGVSEMIDHVVNITTARITYSHVYTGTSNSDIFALAIGGYDGSGTGTIKVYSTTRFEICPITQMFGYERTS